MGWSSKLAFSCPRASKSGIDWGIGLPESGAGPKTRFSGLFGDKRERESGLVNGFDRVERTESLMFGLRDGVTVFAGSCGAEKEAWEREIAAGGAAGVTGIGVEAGRSNCTVDDGVGERRKMEEVAGVGDAAPDNLNLEGERERERRNDRTAELTSTWWTCVGEGRVSVPPLPDEYDIADTRSQPQECDFDSLPDPQPLQPEKTRRGYPSNVPVLNVY
jgi:hypothetical protein